MHKLARASPHTCTPQVKCPIDDYSERSLALLIPGSRLDARNSPSARNRQQYVKKISRIGRNREKCNNTVIFHANYFNVKIFVSNKALLQPVLFSYFWTQQTDLYWVQGTGDIDILLNNTCMHVYCRSLNHPTNQESCRVLSRSSSTPPYQ